VSLIESALEKLRRGAEADSDTRHGDSRAANSVPQPAKVAVVIPPEVEEPRRRLTMDIKALRDAGYLPEEGLERRFADHYRQIKRPVVEKALAGPSEMRIVLVSSALPGDGKTFTSINLALSMARERDISVLLVDADGPRSRLSEVLGIRSEPGLLDALADESVDLESLILRTDIRGLDVLPAGRFIENSTELLASVRMREIAARLVARNPRRLVLFDSAPLLVSSEARVLLSIPGQILLVVRAGVTPRQAILEAVGYVEKTKLQGLILNQTHFQKGSGYYDYGSYGKSEGQSGSPTQDPPE
jgi:protein-tyrosine kinase